MFFIWVRRPQLEKNFCRSLKDMVLNAVLCDEGRGGHQRRLVQTSLRTLDSRATNLINRPFYEFIFFFFFLKLDHISACIWLVLTWWISWYEYMTWAVFHSPRVLSWMVAKTVFSRKSMEVEGALFSRTAFVLSSPIRRSDKELPESPIESACSKSSSFTGCRSKRNLSGDNPSEA